MKLTDLQEGMIIQSPTKGEGVIIKVTKRTVTTKYKYLTTKVSFTNSNVDILYSDL